MKLETYFGPLVDGKLSVSCYYHSNLPAVTVCSRCGRRICSSCYKPYVDLALCPDCYRTKVPKQMAIGMRAPGTYAHPLGGVVYGPFPFSRAPLLVRFWWFPAALFFTAAALIAFNGIALLSPAFFSTWVGIFPWVAPLGYFSFIFGIILGLVIIGGLALFFFGFRVLAAFLVFPAAIVSLLIGGGFIAGLIIGVLASLFVIFSERFHT